MPGSVTTKDENHPHTSLPRRGGGIQGGGYFHINPHARDFGHNEA